MIFVGIDPHRCRECPTAVAWEADVPLEVPLVSNGEACAKQPCENQIGSMHLSSFTT